MITTSSPALRSRFGALRLIPAGLELWRVVDDAGRILGHLQRAAEGADVRYRALRYHRGHARLLPIGDFWSADDAVECLRRGG
ncbi:MULTISPECIES: hypothetical protein [unclassified Microbacterium]|uniref:hypothetical protein n=1 Tax=unclassified Microbacterium TaxID=2609290 RepID=UPI00214C064E|nr:MULTISPECIES: hypothetical protein [unclassified Microbacterium]MCR2785479.1 hypothetical protein [Microbacterium sp. zg.B96]WIM17529.1 hypothetical protein QNO11_07850 [Microbacterium sp. zg-B96]